MVPRVLGRDFERASDIAPLTAHIRGHKMARGGLETAVWDLEARCAGVPLWKQIGGGARREIPCGVSIGIQDTTGQLLRKIETEVDAGYQRIKIKIKPGWDVEVIQEVRKEFPRAWSAGVLRIETVACYFVGVTSSTSSTDLNQSVFPSPTAVLSITMRTSTLSSADGRMNDAVAVFHWLAESSLVDAMPL